MCFTTYLTIKIYRCQHWMSSHIYKYYRVFLKQTHPAIVRSTRVSVLNCIVTCCFCFSNFKSKSWIILRKLATKLARPRAKPRCCHFFLCLNSSYWGIYMMHPILVLEISFLSCGIYSYTLFQNKQCGEMVEILSFLFKCYAFESVE